MLIFVSDAFVDHYVGGAELTTEAIIEGSFLPCNKLLSQQVTIDVMKKYQHAVWIFGNFTGVNKECLIYAIKNLNYSIIEYDYKFCRFRSPKKHIHTEGACSCENTEQGKLVSVFLHHSKVNFWMSEKQMLRYQEKFPFLERSNNVVLSSVFSKSTLKKISSLDTKNKKDRWIILNSPSWIKGVDKAVEYCKNNNMQYELVWGLKHEELLEKLASSRGTVFFPQAADTCPRMIIEAKLLDCELILNEDVQHKDEEWFSSKSKILLYLHDRTEVFWQKIEDTFSVNLQMPFFKSSLQNHFKIIVPFFNAEAWIGKCIESIKRQNYKNFECYMIDDMSTDRSYKTAKEHIAKDKRFKLRKSKKKKYALENIVDGIKATTTDEEDVIILLDGDDWLSCVSSLSKLNDVYKDTDCLITYGSYVYNPGGLRGTEPRAYSKDVIEKNQFREDDWRASHLRTFKRKAWNKIDLKDLQDSSGEFYKMTYDQAIMLPVLEIAGDRSEFIFDVLHVYNRTNPLNVDKSKGQKQYAISQEIRKKKKYKAMA